MVTRSNYEEYFLLYVDNELSVAERMEVERFVHDNPDLLEELHVLQQASLVPGEVSFDRNMLLRNSMIHSGNYEEFFLRSIDGELNEDERSALDHFLFLRPELRPALIQLERTRVSPDPNIVHPNQGELLHEEKGVRLIWKWTAAAAAAAILLVVGWWQMDRSVKPTDYAAIVNDNMNKQHQKKDSMAALDNAARSASGTNNPVASRSSSSTSLASNSSSSGGSKRLGQINSVNSFEVVGDSPEVLKDISLLEVTEVNVLAAGSNISGPVGVLNKPKVSFEVGSVDLSLPDTEREEHSEMEESVIYVANTSIPSKSKLGGFLRKASRFLDRAALIDSSDTGRAIRIANFEIALR